jgi:hypothetical protein
MKLAVVRRLLLDRSDLKGLLLFKHNFACSDVYFLKMYNYLCTVIQSFYNYSA